MKMWHNIFDKNTPNSIYMNNDELLKTIKISSQLELKKIKDMENVLNMSEALWTTTGASIEAIHCDPVFLDHLDFDNNKRIMCFEVKAGIMWVLNNLREREGIVQGSDLLKLDAINTDHKEGRNIAMSASQTLGKLKKTGVREISLGQVRKIIEKIAKTPISGAGVILPDVPEKHYLKSFLLDIINTLGGTKHPSGSEGVDKSKLEEFLTEAKQYVTWYQKGILNKNEAISEINLLGDATAMAFKSYMNVRDKINEFFIQCRLASYKKFSNIDTIAPGKEQPGELRNISETSDKDSIEEYLGKAPLSKPVPQRILNLSGYINCNYEDAVRKFREKTIIPLWGKEKKEITETEWREIISKFTSYENWQREKQGEIVASVGVEKLNLYLQPQFKTEVHELIESSIEAALMLDEIKLLEKLILYQANILKFLNNFVYFPYLYNPRKRAMFEMGTLVMDGRVFKLSFKVDNHTQHIEFSKRSNMYILYVEVLSGNIKSYEIAVPVTSGGKGNLYKGKKGIFHDIHDKDWDAVIVDILENPISIMEAVLTPFRKLTKLLNTKIEELKNVAESKLNTVVTETKIGDQPQQPQAQGTGKTGFGSIFMGGSITIAVLGSAMAFITKTLSEVKIETVLLTILGALFAVMLPTFITAFNKLRKRNLSAILEASGWAVNIKMKLTFKLGRFFTQKPVKQKFLRTLKPFAWIISLVILIAVILLLIFYGKEIGRILSDISGDFQKSPPE